MEKDATRSDTLFALRDTPQSWGELQKWVQSKDYNNFSHGWQDRNGTPGIGLTFDRGGGQFKKLGVIICYDGTYERAKTLVWQLMKDKG